MKNKLALLMLFFLMLFILGCTSSDEDVEIQGIDQNETIKGEPVETITKVNAESVDFLKYINELEVTVKQRAPGSNYTATARGHGVIPSGEYAGKHFNVSISGEYSAVGAATLLSGTASVKIQGDKFNSVIDPILQSFCCGEGDLLDLGTHWEFTVYGQVVHDGHNHLFAGFGSTAGTMNMNVADQSGTVVVPAVPPHDPGIGLIENIPAASAHVRVP
jgi:hypothetical protein